MKNNELLNKLKEIPPVSGCYIFRNKQKDIIYIGKSKCLKNRVRQYFQGVEKKEGKYLALYREIDDVEIIKTETETDALILECRLIKQHQPKYNAQLKRSKQHPFIRISSDPYPSISVVDEIHKDGAKYYGFYFNEDDAIHCIGILNSIWHTPLCGKKNLSEVKRACLNYHIGKCCGACQGRITPAEYKEKIRQITKCLEGMPGRILSDLKKAMLQHSQNLEFEKALQLKNQLTQIEELRRRSKRLNTMLEGRDVFLYFRAYNEPLCTLYFIRDKKTTGYIRFKNDQLNKNLLMQFASQALNGETQYKENIEPEFMTRCLQDIYADKYYIPVSTRMKQENIVSKLLEEYKAYNKQR